MPNDVKFEITFSSNGEAILKKIETQSESSFGAAKRAAENASGAFSVWQARAIGLNQSLDLVSRALGVAQGVFQQTFGAALKAGDTYSQLSQKIGVSVASLSSLSLAAQQADVPILELGDSLRFLNTNIVESQRSNSIAAQAFTALGVSTVGVAGKIKATDKVLLEIADAFAGAEDNAAKTAIAMALFGRAGADLIPFLNEGAAAIREQQELARALGLTWSTETAQAANDFNDTIELLTVSLQGLATDAIKALLPDLLLAATHMLDWAKANREWLASQIVDSLRTGAQYAREWGPALSQASSVFSGLLQAYNSLPEVVKTVGIVGVLVGGTTGVAIGTGIAALTQLKELIAVGAHAGNPSAKAVADALGIVAHGPEVVNNFSASLASLLTASQQVVPPLAQVGAATAEAEEKADGAAKKTLVFGEEQEKAAKKVRTHVDHIAELNQRAAEHIATLTAQVAILQRVSDGSLDYESALKQIAAAELTGRKVRADLATQTVELEAKITAQKAAIEAARQRWQEYTEQLAESRSTLSDILTSFDEQIASLQTQANIYKVAGEQGRAYDDVQRDLAIHLKEVELRGQGAVDGLRGVSDTVRQMAAELVDAQTATDKQREAFDRLRTTGLLTTGDLRKGFEDIATGIVQGTGTAGVFDALTRLGQGMGYKLVQGIAFGKEGLESQVLIPNFEGLFGPGGIVGQIVGQGGQGIGASFVGNLAKSIGGNTGLLKEGLSILWEGLTTGDLSAIVSGGQRALQGMGSVMAGFVGVGFAEGLKGILGFGGSKEAGIGGNIGGLVGGIAGSFFGPIGSAVGSFFGDIFGSLLGGLFAHTPTQGTLIRKGLIDYLKQIKVSFAEELSSKRYFFEETKELAQQMFGDDFLAASKEILTQKAGPDLAKQLQALGAFLTADQAAKLGKPVEQTGTTFGNLLVANLGIDAIPDAIKEIVQKANINFEDLTKKLTSLFDSSAIGADFYKDTIQGAVDLFYGDLPEAINVAALALQSFTDDGVFSLDTFKSKLEDATSLFNSIAQVTRDAIINSKSGEEAAEMFASGLKKKLEELALDRYLKDFIDGRLFSGVDLADGLSDDEIGLLKQRIATARDEADKLISVLKNDDGVLDDTNKAVDKLKDTLGDIVAGPLRQISVNNLRDLFKLAQAGVDPNAPLIPPGTVGLPGEPDLFLTAGGEYQRLTQKAQDFSASFRGMIADAFYQGMADALVQQVLIKPILEPLGDAMSAQVADAMADGILTAQELADLQEIANQAADVGSAVLQSMAPAIGQIGKAADDIRNGVTSGADAFADIDVGRLISMSDAVRANLEAAAASLNSVEIGTGTGKPIKAYATGGYVAQTGLALVHEGEYVIPAYVLNNLKNINDALVGGTLGNPGGYGGLGVDIGAPKALADLSAKSLGATYQSLQQMLQKLQQSAAADQQRLAEETASAEQFLAYYAQGGKVSGTLAGVNLPFNVSASLAETQRFVGDRTRARETVLPAWIEALQGQLETAFGDLLKQIEQFEGSGSPLADQIEQITASAQQLTDALPAPEVLAAIGQDFNVLTARINAAKNAQIAKAVDNLLAPVLGFIGGVGDPVAAITAQFEELKYVLINNREALEAAGKDVDDLLAQLGNALPEKIKEAIDQINQPLLQLLDSLSSAKQGLLVGPNSLLSGEQQVALLQQQFAEATALAQTGDQEAAKRAIELGNALVQASRDAYASSSVTKDITAQVLAVFEQLTALFQGQLTPGGSSPPPGGAAKPLYPQRGPKPADQAITQGVIAAPPTSRATTKEIVAQVVESYAALDARSRSQQSNAPSQIVIQVNLPDGRKEILEYTFEEIFRLSKQGKAIIYEAGVVK